MPSMPTDDELRERAVQRAAVVLPPVTAELVDALGITLDGEQLRAIGHALARAFLEGGAFQAVEGTAQLIESGVDAYIRPIPSDLD
jgi:hypothetical protein